MSPKSHPPGYISTLVKLLIPFLTRPFLWELWNESLSGFVRGEGADAVKNGPHGLCVRQDPFAGISMGCLAPEPMGTIFIGLYSMAQNNPRKDFLWTTHPQIIIFENSYKDKKKNGGFAKSWSTRNSYVRSKIEIVSYYNCFRREKQKKNRTL